MKLLIPTVVLALVWTVGAKFSRPKQAVYLPALAALCAHLAWNVSGIIEFGVWRPFLPDLILRALLIGWLCFRPNKWVAMLLALYTLWSATSYASEPFGGSGTNLPMLVLHAAVLAALAYGLFKSRAKTSEA